MKKRPWTPWHQVVPLRDDLRSHDLPLNLFAADLYDVVMERGPEVYRDPSQFFALTHPTPSIRALAKDVASRLAGRNDRAVRQLVLTYGGGKTHAEILLRHLVVNPTGLPDLPAVRLLREDIGFPLPRARVAVLPFNSIDAVKGIAVRSPTGESRWLLYPWSALAWQLAGADGLRALGVADGERTAFPATNVLADVLSLPSREQLATLVLLDEVLMWARRVVGQDPGWRHAVQDFFQCLTEAATKVDRCAIVASLLAADPSANDELGREVVRELFAIFHRTQEEPVEPVTREDVAEVLRRRFFASEALRQDFRPAVVAALRGVQDIDEQTRREGRAAEERYADSYPFHPDLIDIFYSKWTNIDAFQRTRGMLRTFALALRDAQDWDGSPLIGANVFLGAVGGGGLSEAARELTSVVESEVHEGKRQSWTGILEGELSKARVIQDESPDILHREVEQAVFATFLHSQPIGRDASTGELMRLLGPGRPDKIELEKALRRWADTSWFLDENALADVEAGSDGVRQLPKSWRLGPKPNLKQMHHDACARLEGMPEWIDQRLLDEIAKVKPLTIGAGAAGAKVHLLPERPSDIEDDGEFHYAVLSPRAASDHGKPSAEARRFIDQRTSADGPRVHRNALVLVVPSRDGLEAARNRLRDLMGWEEVRAQLSKQEVDVVRERRLQAFLDGARRQVPDALVQAYCIVVTVSPKNETEAFKIAVGDDSLFTTVKNDSRSRIQATPVTAAALLPDGPYALWREGETARFVKDLVGAFAQFSHLPKMLSRKAILETLVTGCEQGEFVLRTRRPDQSMRTFWREQPDPVALQETNLEVVLPRTAVLWSLSPHLLRPGVLPGLWPDSTITFSEACRYFASSHTESVQRSGGEGPIDASYEDFVVIPQAGRDVVEQAVRSAVREGMLWLTVGPATLLADEIPTGILTDDAHLQAPPPPIAVIEVLPEHTPDAWTDGLATVQSLASALSAKSGKPLPWKTIHEVLEGARRLSIIEPEGALPDDYASAQRVKLRVPAGVGDGTRPDGEGAGDGGVSSRRPGVLVAQACLRPDQLQDLALQIGDIVKAAAGLDAKFRLEVEVGGDSRPDMETVAKINSLLHEVSEELTLR